MQSKTVFRANRNIILCTTNYQNSKIDQKGTAGLAPFSAGSTLRLASATYFQLIVLSLHANNRFSQKVNIEWNNISLLRSNRVEIRSTLLATTLFLNAIKYLYSLTLNPAVTFFTYTSAKMFLIKSWRNLGVFRY
jgi:hypothetical protein